MDSTPPERIAFLGGYLPRLCGIATFTHDLCEAVAGWRPESDCFTGAMNDRPEGYDYPPGCGSSWTRRTWTPTAARRIS